MGSRTHAQDVAVLRASRTSTVLFTGALLVSRSRRSVVPTHG